MHARPAVARGDSRGSGLTEFVVRKLPDRVVELVGSFDVADMTGVRYRVNFTQTPVEPGPSNAAGGRSWLAARSECPHTHRQLALAPDDRSGPAGAVRAIAMRETELSFRHTDVPAACFARREQRSPGAIASRPRGGVGDERRSASRAAPPSAQATNRSGPRANSPAHASEQKK